MRKGVRCCAVRRWLQDPDAPAAFHIDDIFHVPGVGAVVRVDEIAAGSEERIKREREMEGGERLLLLWKPC